MTQVLRIFSPCITLAVVVLLWWAGKVLFEVQDFVLPSPWSVAQAFLVDPKPFMIGCLETGSCAAIGFLLAAVFGILAASIFSLSRRVEQSVYPIALLLQMVPLIAIAPLLVVWFGYGRGAIVASAVIVSIFPIIANTLAGLRAADPKLVELFTLLRAGRIAVWWKLAIPSAVPSMLTGLRIAAGLATIGTIAGEFIAGIAGNNAPLGILVMTGLRNFQTDRVFVAVLLAALVGFALFALVSVSSSLLLRRWCK